MHVLRCLKWHAAVLGFLLYGVHASTSPVQPAAAYDANDAVAALSNADSLLLCVAYYESGRSGAYDPNTIGDYGESHGLLQLHKRGLLPDFYRKGYTNWDSPYQQVAYFNYIRATKGVAYVVNNWTPARACLRDVHYFVWNIKD